MICLFLNVNVKLLIILFVNINGFVLEIWLFIFVLSGIVNIFLVGILVINGMFFLFKLLVLVYICFFGSLIVKFVLGFV